ncbi:MAG: MOSC domain-containing protein [Rhodobacter sp.]|nr:MOSC domain-containing protein [Rhodobacter sp.]
MSTALAKSDLTATITWLGRVADRGASLRSEPLTEVNALLTGFEGEAHGGLTRRACGRFLMLYPRGTEVRNTRQLSILSAEELDAIAGTIGLETLDPGLVGASMVVSGIPDFSHVPVGSRLKSAAGTVVTIDLENHPCQFPAREIEAAEPGHGRGFVAAARGRRGVTAWIEREGPLAVGEELAFYVPAQPAWQPA